MRRAGQKGVEEVENRAEPEHTKTKKGRGEGINARRRSVGTEEDGDSSRC